MIKDWSNKKVLVTGGASFIGSHLVDKLADLDVPYIRIVDDLSSGKLENLHNHNLKDFEPSVNLDTMEPQFKNMGKGVYLWEADLLNQKVSEEAVKDIDVAFHIAADHGGRGYVNSHKVGPATNLTLDGMLFKSAYEEGVEKIVYASSGCVYPNLIQQDVEEELYLKEGDVGPPYDADNMYGWAKLMAEKTLESYYDELGMKSTSLRYFTVYGERGKLNHAITAMIGRAFLEQDPYKVWGDGSAIRNWTRVEDIIDGTIKAAEKIDNATPINLGIERRISVEEAAKTILNITDHNAEIKYLPDKPVGVLNRVADNSRAREMLDWKPSKGFEEGIKDMVDWFYNYHDKQKLSEKWGRELLMER